MPPSTGRLFAVCCRCQIRSTYSAPRATTNRAVGIRVPFRLTRFSTVAKFYDDHKTNSGQELIVLDPPRRRVDESPGIQLSPLDKLKLADISDALLVFEREAQLDATKMEISLLKPIELRVSKERFEQLRGQLERSFNSIQLRSYYESVIAEGPSPPPLLRKSTPKRDCITAIMKDRWGMMIAEEIAEREDVIVSKEISTNKRDIFFLVGEDGRILRDWAHRSHARITVDVANALLRIHASQSSIETIERWLAETISTIITQEFDHSSMSRIVPFEDKSFHIIARMTNVFIERRDKNTIRIAGIGPTLDSINDARRLLLSSADLRLRVKDTLLYNPPVVNACEGALFPVSEVSSLPWIFRGQEWGRWKLIAPKPGSEGALQRTTMNIPVDIITQKSGRRRTVEAVREVLDEMGGKVSNDTRDRGLETQYEATIGHILYNINTDDDNIRSDNYKLDMARFDDIFHDRPRVLCNMFPGIPVFSQDPIGRSEFQIPPPPLSGVCSKEYFQLRFMPSPWSNPDSFERYPPIRITVEIDSNTGSPHTPKIFSIASESNADILIPRLPCDLRFVRRDEINLGVRDDVVTDGVGGVQSGEWDRFMADSHLNPSQDFQLRASPMLQVHVPEWMVLPTSSPSISPPSATTTTTTVIPTDYTFMGMEYRRAVELAEKGYALSRTIVEGGISGGRRTEVKLQYLPPPPPPPNNTPPPDSPPDRVDEPAEPTPPEVSPEQRFLAFVNKALGLVTLVESFLRRKGAP